MIICMQVFDLDQSTERDTKVTLRGLKKVMTIGTLVDNIERIDPSNMTTVQLKTLEQQLCKDYVVND